MVIIVFRACALLTVKCRIRGHDLTSIGKTRCVEIPMNSGSINAAFSILEITRFNSGFDWSISFRITLRPKFLKNRIEMTISQDRINGFRWKLVSEVFFLDASHKYVVKFTKFIMADGISSSKKCKKFRQFRLKLLPESFFWLCDNKFKVNFPKFPIADSKLVRVS